MNTISYQCAKCGYIQANNDICPKCGISLVSGMITEAISARDKWWIDKVNAMFITTLSSGKEVTQHYIVITHTEWQQLKKDMEVKE